jgi:iron complex transport system substrate-binding protein
MAKWCYPDRFSDIDPIKNMKEFYDRFMPIPLDGTWYFNNHEVQST